MEHVMMQQIMDVPIHHAILLPLLLAVVAYLLWSRSSAAQVSGNLLPSYFSLNQDLDCNS